MTDQSCLRAERRATMLFAIGCLVHALFLLSLRFGWLNPLFNDCAHRFGAGDDFFSIYAAGAEALHGASIYHFGTHIGSVPYAYPFRYAPAVAFALAAPLALLPSIRAYALWLVLLEMALVRNIRLTLQAGPDRVRTRGAAAMWLLFSPLYLELFVGQFTFLTGSLVFWAYLAWREKSGEPRASGDLFWSAAVLLKMMPLVFLPIALLRGRARAAALTLALLLGTSALYFLAHPSDWLLFAATNAAPSPQVHAGNMGLMALLFRLANHSLPLYHLCRSLVLLTLALAAGLLTYRAIQAVKEARVAPDAPEAAEEFEVRLLWLYAGLTCIFLLGYQDVWEHHYTLLLGPFVLLALRGEKRWLWLPAYMVAALPTLFVFYDVPALVFNADPEPLWTGATSLLHHLQKPLAPLWLLFGLVVLSLKRSSLRLETSLHPVCREAPISAAPFTASARTEDLCIPSNAEARAPERRRGLGSQAIRQRRTTGVQKDR